MPVEFNPSSQSIREIHSQVASRRGQAAAEQREAAAKLKAQPYGSLKNTWSAVKITLSSPSEAQHLATKFEKLSPANRERLIAKAEKLSDRTELDYEADRQAEQMGYFMKSTPKNYINQRVGLLHVLASKRHLMSPEQQYRLVEAASSSSRSSFVDQNLRAIGYNE